MLHKSLIAAVALVALSAPAFAQVPVKAPPPPVISNGYPYGSAGLFFGAYAEGGGGNVNGSAVGVSDASLVELSAAGGATLGYAWGTKNSNIAFSAEGDIGYTGFNGSSQGLSTSGPLEGEIRGVVFTPMANVTQFLPNWLNFGTLPPFNALPAGVTASHTQIGFMAGVHWNDVSTDFVGISTGKEWRAAPMLGIVQMEQLSNGMAMRTYVKNVFASDALCTGPVPNKQACGGLSNQVIAGVSLLW